MEDSAIIQIPQYDYAPTDPINILDVITASRSYGYGIGTVVLNLN